MSRFRGGLWLVLVAVAITPHAAHARLLIGSDDAASWVAPHPAEGLSAEASVWEDIAAVMLIGMPGHSLDEDSRRHLENGGRAVVLFGRNVASAEQLRALTTEVRCAAGAPVLIAIDEELGRVQRLGSLVSETPPPATVAAMTHGEITAIGSQLGSEMAALGVNLNLAPVADVARGSNPVLEERHLGPDPEKVADVTAAYIEGLQSTGVAATAKHFPGHGMSRVDPHDETTVIDASLDDLQIDLLPFSAAIDAGVRAVLVGHPIYPAIDAANPASVSPAALELLRSLGFEGVAVTDAFSMAGLTGAIPPGEAAVRALVAGEDLIMVNRSYMIDEVKVALAEAVEHGSVNRERLAEAAGRVRQLADWAHQPTCD